MILSPLLTPVVVPPVNLAVAAFVLVWFPGRRLLALSLVMLLLLALPATSHWLRVPLEAGLPETVSVTEARAILILGGDLDRDASGRAVPGLLSLGRLREGAALARSTGLPVGITGGALWGTAEEPGPSVAAVMAQSLRVDFGITPRWIETRSVDTWENARDSAALLVPDGITDVLLVTDAWHMRRSLLAFRDSGLHARPAPVWRIGQPPEFLVDLVPRASAWEASYLSLHEWIGLAWYELRGQL